MNTNEKAKNRKDEIQYIFELLQACLEEEGYVIPFAKYADSDYKGFDVPLNNPLYSSGDNILITVKWY